MNDVEKTSTKVKAKQGEARRPPPLGRSTPGKKREGEEPKTYFFNDQGINDQGPTVTDQGSAIDDYAFASRRKQTGLSFSDAHQG